MMVMMEDLLDLVTMHLLMVDMVVIAGRLSSRSRSSYRGAGEPEAHEAVRSAAMAEPLEPTSEVEALVEGEGEGEEEDAQMEEDQPVEPGPAHPEYHAPPPLGVPLQQDAMVGKLSDYDKYDNEEPEQVKQAIVVSTTVAEIPNSSSPVGLVRCRVPWCQRCGCWDGDDDDSEEPE